MNTAPERAERPLQLAGCQPAGSDGVCQTSTAGWAPEAVLEGMGSPAQGGVGVAAGTPVDPRQASASTAGSQLGRIISSPLWPQPSAPGAQRNVRGPRSP